MSAGLGLEGSMLPRSVKRLCDARREPRESSGASVLLARRGRAIPVGLANISSGAMDICSEILPVGEAIALQQADGAAVPGVVRLVRDGRIGIHFTAPLK